MKYMPITITAEWVNPLCCFLKSFGIIGTLWPTILVDLSISGKTDPIINPVNVAISAHCGTPIKCPANATRIPEAKWVEPFTKIPQNSLTRVCRTKRELSAYAAIILPRLERWIVSLRIWYVHPKRELTRLFRTIPSCPRYGSKYWLHLLDKKSTAPTVRPLRKHLEYPSVNAHLIGRKPTV